VTEYTINANNIFQSKLCCTFCYNRMPRWIKLYIFNMLIYSDIEFPLRLSHILSVAKVVKKYLETLKWDILSRIRRILRTLLLLITVYLFRRINKSPVHFFCRIRKLPEREKVVGNDGQYFNWSVHSFYFEMHFWTDWINLYSQYISLKLLHFRQLTKLFSN